MKEKIRNDILSIRQSLSESECFKSSELIKNVLFQQVQIKKAQTIAIYLHKGNEVRTNGMISGMSDKLILVPITKSKIEFVRYSSELIDGRFGIPEPKNPIATDIEPEVVIVPGVVFGECMHRIGYGKGYYDMYLKNSNAFKIGICYDFQLLKKLPNHPSDIPMDMIITEKRIIK